MVKFKVLFLVAFFAWTVCAQDRGLFDGLDLTYESILEKNKVGPRELVRLWLRGSKSPAEAWMAETKAQRATAAVLIEFPAFHAAERTTILLFRTENEAFYWELVEGARWGRNEEPIKPEVFEALFKEVSAWEQLRPKSADELPEQAFPGYMGILSQSGSTGPRQILLTLDDFIVCPDKKCEPGQNRIGRVMAALEPIYRPEEEKNYKHRSESEIARMSVEERIDEQIMEYASHGTDFSDTYSDVIGKYLLKDGAKTFPYLIKLMDAYNPRRHRDSSTFIATRIATGVDENVVRLRSSEEGRRVIEAMRRLNARMKSEAGEDAGMDFDVGRVTGINSKDYAIADGLWLRYRINMTESELAEFSDYLVKTAPDYPSWSETEYKTNIPRTKTSAFKHTQAPVVIKPLRYYQSYLAFKRSTRPRKSS